MSVLPIALVAAAAAAIGIPASTTNSNGHSTDFTPTITLGAGAFDFRDNAEQDKAADFRLEYRFGQPFWYVFKPMIALEATSDGGGGAFAGIVADWMIKDHWTISPSIAVGAWGNGNGKDMGSVLEFRSQLEAGYKFDNGWRVTGAFSHMSNAEIASTNPGEETVAVYLHIPADTLLPR